MFSDIAPGPERPGSACCGYSEQVPAGLKKYRYDVMHPSQKSQKLSGFVMAALAIVCLPSPYAHAQSLVLNGDDSVTVDGTGTHGTINGKPINNDTGTYMDTGVAGSSAVMTSNTSTSSFTLGSGGILKATGTEAAGLGIFGSGPITVTDSTIVASGVAGYGLFTTGSSPITVTSSTFTADGYEGFGLFDKGTGPITLSDTDITATSGDGFSESALTRSQSPVAP